ncbi:MAG: tetratricopeptide repeat protein [Bacteroidales bacterium]|nr:tetratricopeptide repeat protein [Bacteroidales bacterium]
MYTDAEKALEYATQSFELSDNLNFLAGKALSLDLQGIYYQNKGEFLKAENYYKQSLDIRLNLNIPKLIATSYNNFGVLNRKKGSFESSKEYFLKSMTLSEEIKDSLALSMVYNNLGLLFDNMGQYEESILYHLKSLSIREKQANKTEIASSLNNIGIVFISIEKYSDALNYLLKSLKIKEELGNKRSLASTYVNIGNVYFYQNKFVEALDNFTKSMNIYKAIDDKKSLAATLSNMSYIARKKGDLQLALTYNLESIKLIEEIGSMDQICSSYNSVSATYFQLKDFQKAQLYALKAKNLATENNMLPELKASLNWLVQIYTSLNDYKQANTYLSQYIQVKDSLFNESSNKQILELQAKYETEKKEKEIALLSEKNIQQKLSLEKRKKMIGYLLAMVFIIIIITVFVIRQNKIKQKQKAIILEQKLFRAQMNPHFIFNAISAIQHYILKNNPIEASSYLSSFAKLMRSIITNSKQDLVSIESEKQTLDNYLKLQKLRLGNNLEYTIHDNTNLDAEEIAIPPMLLQPFIENAIEHGILKKKDCLGIINIVFSVNTDKLVIEITDNGIGRIEAEKTKTNDHQSFATEITQSRIKMMKQSYKKDISFNIIDLINNDLSPSGTKVIFEIPLIYI